MIMEILVNRFIEYVVVVFVSLILNFSNKLTVGTYLGYGGLFLVWPLLIVNVEAALNQVTAFVVKLLRFVLLSDSG